MEDKVAPDPSGEVFDKLAKYLLLMQHKNYTKMIKIFLFRKNHLNPNRGYIK
jgi:hypothetical protein